MEQSTERPGISTMDSARDSTSASVQHEQVAQPHSLSQPPGITGRHPPPVAPKQQWDKSPHEDTRQSSSTRNSSVLLAASAPGLSMLATVMQGQSKAAVDHKHSGGQPCQVKSMPTMPDIPLQPSPRSKISKKQQPRTSAPPVRPTSRPYRSPSWGRKPSPKRPLLVSTVHSDHDEGSSYRSRAKVDLSGCLTVQQFVESYSSALPVNVIAIQDELQRACTIHRVEQRTVLRIDDTNFGKTFNVPIESKVKFGIVYNPNGNDREASHGYEFAAISDILKLPRFPAVVAVTKDFSDHYSGSPTVKKHEVLIVRETSAQGTSSRRYLRVYSLLTNSTKDLPEQCAGHFSTNPALVSMCASDLIRYIIPQPFPCQAVMYIPSNNQDTQIPCNLSNVITISDSRIEKSLVASEVSNSTSTCIRIPFECSSKITNLLPEVSSFQECNHSSSGEVIYARPKKKTSIATGECDYEIIPEEISGPLTEGIHSEKDACTTLQSSDKPAKKKHKNPLSAFMQRTLQRRHSTKKSKSAPRPATHWDSIIAMTNNSSYIPTRATTWPRQPHGTSSTSTGNVDPTIFPNVTTDTSSSDCEHYEPIPGDASLEAADTLKETYVPYKVSSISTGKIGSTIFPNAITDTSGSNCGHYEPIPGDASLQPVIYVCQPEPYTEPTQFIPNANDSEYESVLDFEICSSNESSEIVDGTSRPITPSSTCTQTSYGTAQMSTNSEPSAKAATNEHVLAKVIEEQLNYHREEILGRIQVFEDQLKHHKEESVGWMQERLIQLQQPQGANVSESKPPGMSEYLTSRADFVAEDTNMQKIQSLFEHLTSQVDESYGEFRRRLDSFEQQLGQQQNRAYEYIASQSCNKLQSDDEYELGSHSQGQDLQKVHSMLEHLTVVTAQTGESMSESYVQFTKRLDSIEQRLQQQKDIYEPYCPVDCQSKDTVLGPSLCTVQDNTSATFPKETPPLNQPQVMQWIGVMTELHKKLEKRLMEQMESFEQKLMKKQNLMHSSLIKQIAEQQSPAVCHTPQAANQGFQSAKPEPTVKEVARILNGFCRLYELGVQLDISEAALDQLDHNHGSDVGKYRIKVISHWLKNTETPTWEALAQALKDIGEDGLARRILEKYVTDPIQPKILPNSVFISYYPESKKHRQQVATLVQQVKAQGYVTFFDELCRNDIKKSGGLPRWKERCIEVAENIIVVCSPSYYREDLELPNMYAARKPKLSKLQVAVDTHLLRNLAYTGGCGRLIPVVMGRDDPNVCTPVWLQSVLIHHWPRQKEDLLYFIAGVPKFKMPPVVQRIVLKPKVIDFPEAYDWKTS